MADQSIASGPQPGYVTLPDGRTVPTLDTWFNQQANNPQGFGASEQRTAISKGYSAVAQPVTNALGDFISTNPISQVAEKTGLLAPEANQSISRGIASAVIPQNLTQVGILAGMGAGGALAGGLGLSGGMSAATRVMGATAGGAAGGYADYGDAKGALTGAGQGLAQGGVAETAAGLYNYSRKLGVERARQAVQLSDASDMANAVSTAPNLKGVFGRPKTAADLEDLAKGATVERLPDGTERVWAKGPKMLSDYVEGKDQEVKAILDQLQQKYGRTYKFPDALEPGTFTDWDTARKNLSELRVKAWGGVKNQPLEPTIKGVDSKQLYNETRRALQQQLTTADPSGTALAAFNDGQQVFSSGRAWLGEVLRPAFSKKGASGPEFNSEVVQGRLADKRVSLMKRMGVDDYNAAANAVRIQGQGQPLGSRQGPVGSQDVFNPGGALAKVSEILPLPGPAYARVHLGTPDLVGNPLTLGQAARTGVSMGGTQLMSPVAQYLADQMRMQMQPQQGLPIK